MVVPLTPKPTRKTEALAKAPPTIASRREEDTVVTRQVLSLADIFLHVYGRSDPSDYGEAARDLWLQEIPVRPPR